MSLTLRQARRLKDKSQTEMAKALGVSLETYRRIELNPELTTISQAKSISKYLDIPYDEIFFAPKSN